MATSSRSFAAGSFDVFDELSEMLAGWMVPGGPHTGDVLSHAHLEARTRMLDLGCGTGRLLARAARREPSAILVGVDNDRDSIAIARDRSRSAPAPIELHVGSAERLPFADGYFDVVTAVFVLGEMRPEVRSAALAEIARVLKPLGRLVVVDWTRGGCLAARLAGDAVARLPLGWFVSTRRSGRSARLLATAQFDDIESPARYCTLGGGAELTVARRVLAA
jgi:ubiquinone/menaquinone biosynthesis C-methylase UbiE